MASTTCGRLFFLNDAQCCSHLYSRSIFWIGSKRYSFLVRLSFKILVSLLSCCRYFTRHWSMKSILPTLVPRMPATNRERSLFLTAVLRPAIRVSLICCDPKHC